MKWISIHDKLPKSGKVVLVLSSERFITTSSKVGIGTYWNKKDSGGDAHWVANTESDYGYEVRSITHWMPLPKQSI